MLRIKNLKRAPVAVFLIVMFLGGLVALRAFLEPRESPAPQVDLSAAARTRLFEQAFQSRVERASLVADVGAADVLLVGEEHWHVEPNVFLTGLLDSIPERRISLLLEIPSTLQQDVDDYVGTGASVRFDRAVRDGAALPLTHILKWAHANRRRLSTVTAYDQSRATIFVNRALLRDSRNADMADAILRARRAAPSDLIVAYGGQLHMILAGRYRYDIPNRTPAGALLQREGIARSRIRSVLLSGSGKSPACEIVPPGVYSTRFALGRVKHGYFIEYPIFRADAAAELFDYYVHLGRMTRIARNAT